MAPRILIAGIGNAFLGDDGFGVEVVQRLSQRHLPENICVVDFGIRALDLTHALLHGYEAAILIETVQRGCAPGTVFVMEPPRTFPYPVPQPSISAKSLIDGHGIDPMRVLRLVSALGGQLQQIYVVGCEPSPLSSDAVEKEISPAVRRAVIDAIPVVQALMLKITHGKNIPASVAAPLTPLLSKGDPHHAHLPHQI
jgi:hydrogenase maturation protease